jgi:hypothetical protein
MKTAICAVFIALALAGCEKVAEYYNYPDNEPAPSCRMISRSDTTPYQIFETRYAYNSNGYPISITYTTKELDLSYEESYVFNINYDDQNRIVSFTSDWVYGPDQVFFAYEGNSRLPVRDTLRGTFPNVFVEDLTYDSRGRVVGIYKRIIEKWEEDTGEYPDVLYRFYYDLRGNRQQHPTNPGYDGVIRYTDQVNPWQLHPVWQLLNHDYSRNTRVEFILNDEGLPAFRKEGGTKIEYECD